MFVLVGEWVFQQTIVIPIGMNCAPLLSELLLSGYETDFLQGLLKDKDRKLDHTFSSSFRYINDALSLNNSRFGTYLNRIYPNELEVMENTDIKVCFLPWPSP